jgi:hypothetical protein
MPETTAPALARPRQLFGALNILFRACARPFLPLLASRKFQTAVVSALVAFAAKRGLQLSDEMVALVVIPFLAHIAGTAYEDAAQKRGATTKVALQTQIGDGGEQS